MVTLIVRILVVWKILIIYRGFGPNILESSQGASPNIVVPRFNLVIFILESTPWYVESEKVYNFFFKVLNKEF